ncbi:MAG: hypothetical protein FWG16_08020, partial [Micrococcales bacterium]|nr:hypothetical protein [Micrococcales bacterium]
PSQSPELLKKAVPAAAPIPIVALDEAETSHSADPVGPIDPAPKGAKLTTAVTSPLTVVPLPTRASGGSYSPGKTQTINNFAQPNPAKASPVTATPKPAKKRPLSTRAALMVAFAAVLITFCLIVGLLMVTGLIHGGDAETESIGPLVALGAAFLPGG